MSRNVGETAPPRPTANVVHGDPESDATRLEAVEIKLAHLERAIQDLSDVVYRQQQDLDRVREMNRQLSLQIDEVASRADDPSVQERPPHY